MHNSTTVKTASNFLQQLLRDARTNIQVDNIVHPDSVYNYGDSRGCDTGKPLLVDAVHHVEQHVGRHGARIELLLEVRVYSRHGRVREGGWYVVEESEDKKKSVKLN